MATGTPYTLKPPSGSGFQDRKGAWCSNCPPYTLPLHPTLTPYPYTLPLHPTLTPYTRILPNTEEGFGCRVPSFFWDRAHHGIRHTTPTIV